MRSKEDGSQPDARCAQEQRRDDDTMTKTAKIRTLGVPKEIKTQEYRVAMTPDGVREFERQGIEVFVETGAGEGASFRDDDYRAAGATIVPTAADAWGQEMVVKVKEPKAEEFSYLRTNPHNGRGTGRRPPPSPSTRRRSPLRGAVRWSARTRHS